MTLSLAMHDVDANAAPPYLVQQAIESSGGNQTRAAELLGISRDQLRYRLKKLSEGANQNAAGTA